MAIERIVPGTNDWKKFYANHISRYIFAENLLRQKQKYNILDAACGVGYGSNLLSNIPETKVIGIDRSNEALKIANEYFNKPNITYLQDDCDTLAKSKAYGNFDVIVSFETLEHLKNPKLFLKNCYDLLEPKGLLIISTPNSNISSPDGVVNWEFHEKEYTALEMVSLLKDHGFKDISVYGQQYTQIGKFRMQIAGYFNTLNSNPFIRLGRWIQKSIRGLDVNSTVNEELEDFEIVKYQNTEEIDCMKTDGPFVLIALAYKA